MIWVFIKVNVRLENSTCLISMDNDTFEKCTKTPCKKNTVYDCYSQIHPLQEN